MNHVWMPSSNDPYEGSAKSRFQIAQIANIDHLYAIADKIETNVMDYMMSNVLLCRNEQ